MTERTSEESPKIVRTPRVWTETCSACRGRGVVGRRQHFALYTPHEYEAVMGEGQRPELDPKYDAPSDAIICWAPAGSDINGAVSEGVAIANLADRPVAFEFNGALAICRPKGIPDAIVREWWKRAYGRTYEESMRDR